VWQVRQALQVMPPAPAGRVPLAAAALRGPAQRKREAVVPPQPTAAQIRSPTSSTSCSAQANPNLIPTPRQADAVDVLDALDVVHKAAQAAEAVQAAILKSTKTQVRAKTRTNGQRGAIGTERRGPSLERSRGCP
jgi:hypothetical protein